MISRRAIADGVVVAVKKKSELLVENLIAGREFLEDHLLEEPRRVCDVPFRRRDIDDGLRDVIFDLKRLTQNFRVIANRQIEFDQISRSGGLSMNCLHTPIKPKSREAMPANRFCLRVYSAARS